MFMFSQDSYVQGLGYGGEVYEGLTMLSDRALMEEIDILVKGLQSGSLHHRTSSRTMVCSKNQEGVFTDPELASILI